MTFAACAGRVEWGIVGAETYGHPGEKVWTIIGHTVGSPAGATMATAATVQVKIGTTTLNDNQIIDVFDVRSTKHAPASVRVVAFTIPDLAPGRYPIQLLNNNVAVTMAQYYLTILAK